MMITYIGEDEEWENLAPPDKIKLEKNKAYDIEISIDGPQMIVNGQRIMTEQNTAIVQFVNSGIWIPYAPNLLQNFWRVN